MRPATPASPPPAAPASPVLNLGWVRLGIQLTVAAYAVMLAYGLWADGGNLLARAEEMAAVLLTAGALLLSRRRPRAAVFVVLAVVWTLSMLAIAQWGYYGGGALVALPVVIVGAGMVLGGRGAAFTAAACCGAVPVAFLLPGWLLPGGARFDFRSHSSLLIISELVFVATALLVRTFIASYNSALERSERASKRYGELFALAPDGLLELDASGAVRDANAAALRLLREERTAVVGESLTWLLRRAGAEGAIELATVRPGAPLELTLRPGSAEACNVEISVQQRLGSEARTLLIARDVTARRQFEERLAHTQRLETVGRLAGGIAHDFNNMLTAIGGNAGLLIDYPDPSVREMAADMMEAHRRGAALTRQLLAFARRDRRHPEVMEISTAMREMKRLLERILGEQHHLVLRAEAPCWASADRGQIEQVLLNLTSNARDAMPSGGDVTVTATEVDRAAAAVLGSTLAAERQVMLAVADTGTGMAPEVRARLFEPFFTTKPRGRGTGLGLSIVHGIVLQSDGAIQIESAPGRGTTVRVFLPVCAAPAPGRTDAPARPDIALAGGEHVLLVEDEVAVRRFVERALVDGGYRVTNANDSTSALAIFAAARPPIDLVLTDIVMPGMSGLELGKRLVELHGAVPVLFMSGHFEAGKDDPDLDPTTNLLTKPFSADELLLRVRERLQAAAGGRRD